MSLSIGTKTIGENGGGSGWANMTDVNERRKAQNRVAQRNYRSRQKLRMKLAEAVLLDLPQVKSALAASAGSKKKLAAITAAMEDVADGFCVVNAAGNESPINFQDCFHLIPAAPTDNRRDSYPSLAGQAHGQIELLQGFPEPRDCVASTLDFVNSSSSDSTPHAPDSIDSVHSDKDHWLDLGVDYPSPSLNQPSQPATPSLALITTEPSLAATPGPTSARTPIFCGSPSHQETTPSFEGGSPGSALGTGSTSSHSSCAEKAIATAASGAHLSLSSPPPHPHPQTARSRSYPVEATSNPLLTAIALGNMDIARLLICAGAKLDAPDRNGKTALHLAVEAGNVDTTRALLELGADVLTTDNAGRGLLHTAVEWGHNHILQTILGWCRGRGRGQVLGGSSQDQVECTDKAASAGAPGVERGNCLVGRCVNAQDGRKMTAVHLCVLLERTDMLKTLLEYGADVNIGCE